jgi:hypothetical protein
VLLVGMILLIPAHAALLRFAVSRAQFSILIVSGVAVLVVVKHLGLAAPLLALFRRRFRRNGE